MMPLPTVPATFVETSDPSKLKTAARANAIRGVNARVDTDVAIAFAASWKPFVKSKPRATTIKTMRPKVSKEVMTP